jgi:hypothetical protein
MNQEGSERSGYGPIQVISWYLLEQLKRTMKISTRIESV